MPVQGADPSVYSTLGTNTPNMLGMVGQFAGAQNQLNQNQLFQQTIKARQALGPLMQQAVGPDGQVDYNKAGLLVSTNPDTAFMAPDILNQFAQKQLVQAETMKTNLDNFAKKQSAIGAAAYGLSQEKGDSVEPKDVMSKLTELMSAHGIEAPDAVAYMAGISGLKGPELNKHLQQLAMSSLRGGEMAGNIDLQDTKDPNTGAPTKTFTNKLAGTAQTIGGPQQGAPTQGVSTAPGAGPFQGVGPGTGGPGSPGMHPAGGAQPQPQAPIAPSGPTPFGPTPDKAAAIDYMGKEYYPQLVQAGQQATQAKQLMTEAKSLMTNFDPNRASEVRAGAARWLESIPGISKDTVANVAGGDVSNAQALQKLMIIAATQGMAQANKGNAAVRSVQEWQKFQEANPNITTDKNAITKMYDYMNFQADMTKQEQRSYDEYRSRPNADVTTWPAKWNDFATDQSQKYFASRAKNGLFGPQ